MTASASLVASVRMDRLYRRQRYIYNLTRKYFLLGRDRLIERLEPGTGNVLELGCGTGRNLIRCARRFPTAQIHGIDISAEMLATADRAVAREHLAPRIRLARADVTCFHPVPLFGNAQFDRIFISYCLSMIPDWCAVLHRALAMLAPDGELHIVDFGGQEALPAWFRAALRKWLSCFDVEPRDQLWSKLMEMTDRNRMAVTLMRPYRGYAQYAVVKRLR